MSASILELPPGTTVRIDGPRPSTGLVLAMWYLPTGAPAHLVAWNDRRITVSNFGLAPDPAAASYSSSLRVQIDPTGRRRRGEQV